MRPVTRAQEADSVVQEEIMGPWIRWWRGKEDGGIGGLWEKEVLRMTPKSPVVWMEGPLPGDQEASWRQGRFQMTCEPALVMKVGN